MSSKLTQQQQQLLLAYTDKQLSAADNEKAQALLNQNEDAVAFVEHLQLSALPYVEAFEPLLEQPIPRVQALEANSGDSHSIESTSKYRLSLAASLLIGLLIGIIGSQLGSFNNREDLPPDWVSQVANYQQLYVRSTVDSAGSVDLPAIQALMQVQLGEKLSIPDLNSKAIEFRRGQLLQVEDKPLIQLAYLPESGVPIALCIMKDSDATFQESKTGLSHGLRYSHWQSEGLRFVLIADVNDTTIRELTTIAQTGLIDS